MTTMRTWIDACRPKTLVAAVVPVAVGTAVFGKVGGSLHVAAIYPVVLSCLGFALLAQIVSNFANDLGDSLRGADTPERVGPRRSVANGLISVRAMGFAVAAAVLAAFLAGLPVGLSDPVLFAAGILALVLALGYTLGPWPLAYLGLGDVFVVGCFGVQATALTVYALSVSTSTAMPWSAALLAGLGLGLLADNILLANNARDLETDQAAGKRTTVVRFGRGFACRLHAFNCLVGLGALTAVFGWSPMLLLPLAIRQHRAFRRARQPAEFVPFLEQSAILLLLAGILCVTATCLGRAPAGTLWTR